MSDAVIKIENISKKYMLGTVSSGTLYRDLQSWWARYKGNEDPNMPLNLKGQNEEFWALKDVSFEIHQGDRVGIIGRNGAGKSTLLKILSRVTTPTSGQIQIKGRVASLLEVGTGFHAELTGRENIYLNGAILGMKKQEIANKFDEIVDFSGVEKFIDTPVKRYSSGMYVRLAFAVAAHLEPDILVVDEVLAVGDADFQKKCLGKMEDVSKNQGRTVLFVSHNMTAIRMLCNQGIFFDKGRLALNGSIEDAIQTYFKDKNTPKVISSLVSDAVHYDGSLDILSMESLSSKDNNFSVPFNEPLQILFKYKVNRSIKDFFLTLSISTADGVILFNTPSYNNQLLNLEPGTYTAILEIDHKFRAGTYSLHVGARAGISTIWWKGCIGNLEVIVNSDTDYDGSRSGMFHTEYSWKFL